MSGSTSGLAPTQRVMTLLYGMVARLLRREESRVDLLLNVGVVLRELGERAVAEEIHARVADLADQ
jgi:hypothetical protein